MLVDKVQKQIKKQNMISAKDRIIVGLSGGADSVGLLLVLCELREKLDFSLEAIHVEHGIRGEESRQDASFAEQLCREYQVPCKNISVDVPFFAKEQGLGLEEAARILRYNIFEQIAKEKYAKIALAHHMEDNAETVLFQLARGSSLTGLCGIQPLRESQTGVTYIRPLLGVHREEIERFLADKNQIFCVDSTNQELEYSRNYLRNVILPEFRKINHQVVTHINETAESLSEIRGFLDEQIELYWVQVVTVEKMTGDILLDVPRLKQLHVVLQKELIYRAIGRISGGKKDISSVHVQQVMQLLEQQSGKETSMPNGVVAMKEHATIRLFVSGKKASIINESPMIEISEAVLKEIYVSGASASINIGNKGQEIKISIFEKTDFEMEIPRKTYTKWFDYDKIKDGFCIRTRQSGDYLIYDVQGHRKKLKQYFIDEKIPVTKRDEIYILAQENQVLWVVGGRISEDVKVTEQTQSIVEITYKEEG